MRLRSGVSWLRGLLRRAFDDEKAFTEYLTLPVEVLLERIDERKAAERDAQRVARMASARAMGVEVG